MKEQEISQQEKCDRLGRNLAITKPIDGWIPPDTAELSQINNLLSQIGKRLHSLRIAVLLNDEQENGRIRRFIHLHKKAVKKAFRNGMKAGRKLKRKNAWRKKT